MTVKTKNTFNQAVDKLVEGLALLSQAKEEAIQHKDIMSAYHAERREEETAATIYRASNQAGLKVPAQVQAIMDRITVRNVTKKDAVVQA